MKDSGKRETFESGAMREPLIGQGRYDLLSPFAIERLAIVLERGGIKYEDRNWEKGQPFSVYIDRALRHIFQYMMGDRSEDHPGHAMWNMHALMHTEHTHPEMNDLPNYKMDNETKS